MTAAACSDSSRDTPTSPDAQPAVIQQDNASFYYHDGARIYLSIDPSRVVVQHSDARLALEEAQTVARGLGLSVVDGGDIPQAANHRLLYVPATTSAAVATQFRAQLRARGRFLFASPVYRTDDGNDLTPLNRVAVQFRNSADAAQVERVIRAFGAHVLRPPRPDSGFFYHILEYPRDSGDYLRVAARLSEHPLVAWADPDNVDSGRRLHYTPSDAYFPVQVHLTNNLTRFGVPVDLDVQRAWDLSLGAGVIMGILDDGFDINQHDYLTNTSAWDLLGGFPDHVLSPYCDDTHGTSIAGIIGAQQNNPFPAPPGGGVSGVAPGITQWRIVRGFRRSYACGGLIQPVQVASAVQLGDGLNFLWSAGAHVINNSWGGGSPSNAITNAIRNAVTQGRGGRGTVVVFSAGNTSARHLGQIGPVQYPASLPEVISVSAINRGGNLTDYAPRGRIDVVTVSGHITGNCVGEIVTTDRAGSAGCDDGPNGDQNYTETFSGTSAAAPQVAGLAALILSRFPTLTVSQVRARITGGAISWTGFRSDEVGAGKVSAYNAVR
jgi:subtilisin family serine protease